ncbi:disintegrin and metalloproteinase domain-containing protein 2-like [Tenrec ecaudatus]|uniref:disintegrin and metalloproteinase domain-containing protein 2-like n=1 Tax=Tenrec ecaudatus TaxID=94439 RepID=UPI003F592C9B
MSSLFAFCVFIGLQTMSEPVQADFQITIPEKIGSTIDEDFESQVFYKILIEGKTYTVNLTQKNILPYNFRVYGYNSSEIMKPLIQKFQNLCNYQGHVEGFPNSAVTISTCFGLRGLIQFENVSYGIEPIETSIGFEHIIYPIKNKNTSYTLYTKMNNEQTQLSHKIPRAIKFDHMGANTATVSQKAFQVIGLASAMLNSLNITLILSSLELWISDNRISVNGEADELLYQFLKWKNTYLVLRPHDVALLLVYREKSNYVGATLKGIMCDIKNSGGIVLYSRAISLEALALIITQLLSLGMGIAFDDHKCRCAGAVCVMSPKAIHFSGVKPFSSCSLEDFTLFISKPNSHCLHNQPHLDPSYKVSMCGDKRVDDGEQCDCGGVEECRRDPCCEYKTCRFKQNALCAHGPCCTQCQLRAKGEICRLPEDECDLPEYCNGSSNFCPENFYLHDGYRCNMNKWVCLKGKCRDGTKVCEEVFGQGNNVAETVVMLKRADKDSAMRKVQVYTCFSGFESEMSIDDKAPSGCPSAPRMHENDDKIPALMLKDGRHIIEDMGELSGLSWSRVQGILMKDLGMRGSLRNLCLGCRLTSKKKVKGKQAML